MGSPVGRLGFSLLMGLCAALALPDSVALGDPPPPVSLPSPVAVSPPAAYPPPVAGEGPDAAPDVMAVREIYDAVRGGNLWFAAALLLVASVASSRWIARRILPDDASWKGRSRRWLLSGEGAITLTVLGSLSASTATALGAHAPLDLDWLLTSVKVAFGAAGTVSAWQHTIGDKAKESRTERREITGAIKAGAVPAPGDA